MTLSQKEINSLVSGAAVSVMGQIESALGICARHGIPVQSVEMRVTIKSPLLLETDGEWVTVTRWEAPPALEVETAKPSSADVYYAARLERMDERPFTTCIHGRQLSICATCAPLAEAFLRENGRPVRTREELAALGQRTGGLS